MRFQPSGIPPLQPITVGGLKVHEIDQVINNNEGQVFAVTPRTQLDRFLICGTAGGTFYQDSDNLITENLAVLKPFLDQDPVYVIDRAVEISTNGRARNNDYALAILALAFTSTNPNAKQLAAQALPKVARTGTHLLHFVDMVDEMRGWGSSLKKAVADWFTSKSVSQVTYQMLKYQRRDNWAMRDVLRLSHPKPPSDYHGAAFRYVTRGEVSVQSPDLVLAMDEAKTAPVPRLVELISQFGLTREMLPTEALNEAQVWEALLVKMKGEALIRNLGKLSNLGILSGSNEEARRIAALVSDGEFLRAGRLHPLQMLSALTTYSQGRGDKGSLLWTPSPLVVDALQEGFYESFELVEPCNKRLMLALDVSASMQSNYCSGAKNLTCRVASAVMAMVTVRKEPWTEVKGFSTTFMDLNIKADDRLEEVIGKISGLPFAGTDCALPMLHAAQRDLDVDGFVVYTDNETRHSNVTPSQALYRYREKKGIRAKMAVIAMTATPFTIADPKDLGSMDFSGFDSAVPRLLADFLASEI